MKMSKKFPKLKCREMNVDDYQGRIRGGAPPPPPLKLEKI